MNKVDVQGCKIKLLSKAKFRNMPRNRIQRFHNCEVKTFKLKLGTMNALQTFVCDFGAVKKKSLTISISESLFSGCPVYCYRRRGKNRELSAVHACALNEISLNVLLIYNKFADVNRTRVIRRVDEGIFIYSLIRLKSRSTVITPDRQPLLLLQHIT